MPSTLKVLNSKLDQSVNFVEEQLAGFLESRYVRRCDDYFVCYLSSHTGCNRGCTFCHLTATNQTSFTSSTPADFLIQASQVFRHYKRQYIPAKYMHYSFMARGEPLENTHLLNDSTKILSQLAGLASEEKLPVKFNISTIMPITLKKKLSAIFPVITPTIYYSLYSCWPGFREKWMPGSMQLNPALSMLKDYQDFSKKIIKIHFPFINGENDSLEDMYLLCQTIDEFKLLCEFNLVRYNPASPEQGIESPKEVIERNLEFLRSRFPGKVKEVPRVGFDVSASCGMFASE